MADLQAMIDKLATLPLAAQPGSDWRYGPSVDIQGYLVEKLSGQKLDVFLQTKIFDPLGMKDTGFWVDAAKAPRVTNVFTYSEDKKIIAATTQSDPVDESRGSCPAAAACSRPPTTTSGSHR